MVARAVLIASIFLMIMMMISTTTRGVIVHNRPINCLVDDDQYYYRRRACTSLWRRRSSSSSSSEQYPKAFLSMELMLMLNDDRLSVALQEGGYGTLSVALQVVYRDLLDLGLHCMTLFALDDASLIQNTNTNIYYLRNLKFHIVPNRLLTTADLESLPPFTELPTMKEGKSLVVLGNGNGSTGPFWINDVYIKTPDFIRNPTIVIHGLSRPFPS